ncbi:MAG: hypothetical protein QOE70_4083 [Chthoniobacter sp.]|jgi:hypothetical protein|nr:hypothetical protein [Chthoniobacter sp.]
MAGLGRLLIVWALGALTSASAQTTPAPAKAPRPEGAPAKRQDGLPGVRKKNAEGTPSPEFDNVRKAIEALTPEQRKRFQENFVRWANLPPEEKGALVDREAMRKKLMEKEVDAAIKESGLVLDADRQAQFVKRYGDERRMIEEHLRKEMAEKRRPMVKELIVRLKEEFSGAVPAAPTPPLAQP